MLLLVPLQKIPRRRRRRKKRKRRVMMIWDLDCLIRQRKPALNKNVSKIRFVNLIICSDLVNFGDTPYRLEQEHFAIELSLRKISYVVYVHALICAR